VERHYRVMNRGSAQSWDLHNSHIGNAADTERGQVRDEINLGKIGMIYRSEMELQSHYASASLPGQFDAYVWFDETRAVTPLSTQQRESVPETWPFGV
jgi:erythromycin esterase-like protein